jgi:hypothetical protein
MDGSLQLYRVSFLPGNYLRVETVLPPLSMRAPRVFERVALRSIGSTGD